MTAKLHLLAALLFLAGFACARSAVADPLDLYQARTIVTGQGEVTRIAGFAQALEDVLIKVSGDAQLAANPGVGALDPAPFVRDFHYRDRMAGIPVHDEQGTRDRPYDLTVAFNPDRIDAALVSLGRRKWTNRPDLALAVDVRIGDAEYTLTRGARGRDMREALRAVSDRLGLVTILPEEAALANPPPGTGAPLLGTLTWSDKDLGWIADWRLTSGGQAHRWQVRGVSFDRAFYSGVSGAAQILSGNGHPE